MTADLFREARARRAVESRLTGFWYSWGYRELLLPSWLPWEEVGFGARGLAGQACKLLDAAGEVLTLRPDHTLLVARLAARELADAPRPLRVCYRGEVFRRGPGGGVTAVPQAGVELVGSASPLADAEVLALAAASLRVLGLADYRLAVGHVGVLRELLAAAGLAAASRERVTAALQQRDYVALEAALAAVPAGGELWQRLTQPVPAEEFRDPGDGRLGEVLALLRTPEWAGKVVVDLGLVRDLDYYTGLVFEVMVPRVGTPLGGGGRYDGLPGRYGRPEPATGFAFEVPGLLAALDGDLGLDGGATTLVVPRAGGGAAAWARAAALRSAGTAVELEVGGRSLAEAVAYARRRGMRRVVAVSPAGEEEIPL